MKVIDIRPGEKLHDDLTGEDEGRDTVSCKAIYVFMSSMSWWNRQSYTDTEKLLENIVCTSDTKNKWLNFSDLRRIAYRGIASWFKK